MTSRNLDSLLCCVARAQSQTDILIGVCNRDKQLLASLDSSIGSYKPGIPATPEEFLLS